MSAHRDISLDLMKAIGILAIIVGHYGIGRQFVYSFHVPLFFVIGGYLFKKRTLKEELQVDSKRLLVPYFLTSAFILAWDSVLAVKNGNMLLIKERVIEILLGGGTPQTYMLFGDYGQIGAIWFLLALLWCRVIYNALNYIVHGNILSAICITLSVLSVYVFNRFGALPWDILQGLTALVFYDAGRRIRASGGWSRIPIWMIAVSALSWGLAIAYSHMSIAYCMFRCYPLDVVGAIGATVVIAACCQWISQKSNSIIKHLAWIGKNSLALLCLHLIDLETEILHKIQHWTVDWHYHNAYLHALIVITGACVLILTWNSRTKLIHKICRRNS